MSKNRSMTWLGLVAVSATALGLAGCASPGGGEEDVRTLTFANSYSSNEPHNMCGTQLVREQIADAGVGLAIEIYPGSQLGPDADRLNSVMEGDIDLDLSGSAALSSTYAPVGVVDMAYAFDDADHLFRWWDSAEGQRLKDDTVEATDVRILDIWFWGERHYVSKEPIETPDDFEGMRLRAPSTPIDLLNAAALGVDPVTVAFEEVYLALQQGTIDGLENPIVSVSDMSFDEVTNYVNATAHRLGFQLVAVSERTWQELSAEQQEALQAAVSEAREPNRICRDELTEEILAEWEATGGPEFLEVDVAPFREKAVNYLEQNLDGRELELYQSIRSAAE